VKFLSLLMLNEVVFIANPARYRIVSNIFSGQKLLDIETIFYK